MARFLRLVLRVAAELRPHRRQDLPRERAHIPGFHPAYASWVCNTWMGLGELTSAPGAAAEDAPGLGLGVRALARCAQPGMGAVGLFLGFRFVLPVVRDLRVARSCAAS